MKQPYVAIVREPFSHFISAFNFYGITLHNRVVYTAVKDHPENPYEGFLKNTEKYLRMQSNPTWQYFNNRMSIDLGFPLHDFERSKGDKVKIDKFVKSLDKTMSLVMVVELLEESLVLLRRMLNWETQDILFVTRNAFKSTEKTPSWTKIRKFSAETMQLFQKWDAIDIAVYNHFLEKLVPLLQTQGAVD